jgi:hypothetical protein
MEDGRNSCGHVCDGIIRGLGFQSKNINRICRRAAADAIRSIEPGGGS